MHTMLRFNPLSAPAFEVRADDQATPKRYAITALRESLTAESIDEAMLHPFTWCRARFLDDGRHHDSQG